MTLKWVGFGYKCGAYITALIERLGTRKNPLLIRKQIISILNSAILPQIINLVLYPDIGHLYAINSPYWVNVCNKVT